MAKNGTYDIELKAFDDLFETDESRADMKRERLMDIPVSNIRDFPDHPYHVKDDENMAELVESILTRGLLQPVLVRPLDDGTYEMVSGHRRKRAFEIAKIDTIRARVSELTRDEAILSMVDSNLQREEILPSEKAFAYKMRLEALKRQAGRPSKENSGPEGPNLAGLRSNSELASQVNESETQIKRYIRLTYLIPELLEIVDEKKIAMRPAVEISYLPEEMQYWLLDAIECQDATPSHAQTIKMRKYLDQGKLTREVIDSIMDEEKPNQREKPAFRDERITKLIPPSLSNERQCEYVIKALQFYNRHKQRGQER